MSFQSILFTKETTLAPAEPDCFVDLNLDQVINVIVSGKEEYNLSPFFYMHLTSEQDIVYRQEIMRDIENPILFSYIEMFAKEMSDMRTGLAKAEKSSYQYEKERLVLDAMERYCDAINSFVHNLSLVNLESTGLLDFQQYLLEYLQSETFTSLLSGTKKLVNCLSTVKYGILTKELDVQVRPYNAEADYTAEVEKTFEKFKQNPVKDYLTKYEEQPGMNHVEAAILKGVTILYPEIFQTLTEYYKRYFNYGDETIKTFDREIQFYIAYIEYISKIKKSGLQFCYPEISGSNKEVYDYEGFDIALAYKLAKENSPVVCNDFYTEGDERIIMVTGPNQGGKTTFARTFGQLHYLANIGCPVAGSKAKLFLYDKLLTHFEKEENLETHHSKFEEDLYSIHDILNRATTDSIIIMNEILSSTTLKDSIFISKKIMEKIDGLDALCIWVTFIDELIPLSKKTVSMVSTVVPENPAMRTFKVIRKAADGLAYAISIAEKYKVTYDYLKERMQL